MPPADSALDSSQMAYARALLAPRPRPERVWPALAAAALLAVSALGFAAAMILAPALVNEPVAANRTAG